MRSPSLEFAVAACLQAGRTLIEAFRSPSVAWAKDDQFNVVTSADLASEAILVDAIVRDFPGSAIIAEERGFQAGVNDETWIIDPLDGTSNFVAGIPWFGILLARVRNGVPDLGVMYLPALEQLYTAEAGKGAFCNGERLCVSTGASLKDALWAYGIDGTGRDSVARFQSNVLNKLLHEVRNIRTTNCLLDAAFTSDGRFGGMLNWNTRLWDIVAPSLIVREARGLYTMVDGENIDFDFSPSGLDRSYAVLAGAPILHEQVAALVRSVAMGSSSTGPTPEPS